MTKSILIITLPPLTGGVPDKARILANHLRRLGYTVTISHYATYRDYPELSVAISQLFTGKKPTIRNSVCFSDFPCISIGCWFPELEFTYYLNSKYWRRAINAHHRHIVVGGTVLTSHPLTQLGIRHLIWCASSMIEDRIARRNSMFLLRKLIDKFFISPIQKSMETKILSGSGTCMAVSSYTSNSLIKRGGDALKIIKVPIPIDLHRFQPPSSVPKPGTIGFAGRPEDPRKNLMLLFRTLRILIKIDKNYELLLTGNPTKELQIAASQLNIQDNLTWEGWLNENDLPNFYNKLDIFVIPSSQEGLNIAGLQALSSGIPVISTKCGGPEDYVINGVTGHLVSSSPNAMAKSIMAITKDRKTRDELGSNARKFVEKNYSHQTFDIAFSEAWYKTWGDRP